MSDTKRARAGGDPTQLLNDVFDGDHDAKGSPWLHDKARALVACGNASVLPLGNLLGMELDLDYPAIADRIKRLRVERKENQYEVAAAAEVSRVTVTQWESGRKKPSREKLVSVAKHFGVPVDFILYGDRQSGSVKIESKEEERMLLLARQVPQSVRAAVIHLMENAADVPGEPFKT